MLQPWQRKAAFDAIKTMLPFQDGLRALKRRLAPGRPEPARMDRAVRDGLQQIELLQAAGISLAGARCVEIGSGWCPVVPMLYRLAGVRSVVLTDVERLLDLALLRVARDVILEREGEIAARLGIDRAGIEGRLALGETLDSSLARLGFDYRVPWRAADVAAGAADLIWSRTVFEHIQPPLLSRLLHELRPALAPAGLMVHTIDNSDHFAAVDRSIGPVNFLRYSDPQWRLYCLNAQNYQSRLRHSDYRSLFLDTGYEIVREVAIVDEAARLSLAALPLQPRFRDRDPDDLATVLSVFMVRPPAA